MPAADIQSDELPRSAWRRLAMPLILAAVTALVCLDPYLSPVVPRRWWDKIWLADFPFRLTAVVLIAALATRAALWANRRAGYYTVLFIFVLIGSAQISGFKLGFIDPLDVFTFMAFGIWLSEQFLRPKTPVVVPGILYFAALLFIIDIPLFVHQGPVRFVIGFLGLLKVVLLTFVIVNIIRSEQSVRLAVRVFIGVAVVSALIGITQSMLYHFAGIKFSLIDEFGNSETYLKATFLGVMLRASGLNATVQHLSGFLVLALPFLMFRVLAAGGRERLKYLLGCAILLGGIVLSWNYTAFAATFVVLALSPFVIWPQRALHIILAMLVVALVLYYTGVFDWVYRVYLSDSGAFKGFGQRFTLMKFGFEKLARDPWLGEGLRGFAGFSGNYWHRPVHNAYMQAATEIGLLGALVFVGMLLTMLTQLLLQVRRATPEAQQLLKPALLGMIGLMSLMLGEPMLDHSNTWLYLGLAQSVVLLCNMRAHHFLARPVTDRSLVRS
ncbi:MAG: O-antigen ligase family protein [Sulfuricaulis sp.]|nr:O-antigen ligase family protein [Sulfuricaulis sp.]